MNCALLSWAASQDKLKPHELGILIRLVTLMDDDGRLLLPQSEIWPHMGIGERQTRAAISALVSAGYLKRTRRGAIGKGRAPDLLSANFQPSVDSGESPPLSCDNGENPPPLPLSVKSRRSADNGDTPPPPSAKSDSADNAVELPVSEIQDAEFVDNPQAACIGTRAPAETLNLNTTSQSEIHSSSTELVVGEFALQPEPIAKPNKRGTRMSPDWRPDASALREAAKLGIVNGWQDATLANFIDYWLGVPGAKGIKLDWNATYRNALRAEANARRHIPRNYQTTEARNDHASSTPATFDGMDIRRGKISPGTALLMRKIAGGDANDERRVEPRTGK